MPVQCQAMVERQRWMERRQFGGEKQVTREREPNYAELFVCACASVLSIIKSLKSESNKIIKRKTLWVLGHTYAWTDAFIFSITHLKLWGAAIWGWGDCSEFPSCISESRGRFPWVLFLVRGWKWQVTTLEQKTHLSTVAFITGLADGTTVGVMRHCILISVSCEWHWRSFLIPL